MFSHSRRFLSFVRVSMKAVIPRNQIKNRIEASDRGVEKNNSFSGFFTICNFYNESDLC